MNIIFKTGLITIALLIFMFSVVFALLYSVKTAIHYPYEKFCDSKGMDYSGDSRRPMCTDEYSLYEIHDSDKGYRLYKIGEISQ